MSLRKLAPIGAVALTFILGPAEASPAHTATSIVKADGGSVTQVQWGRRRGWGPGPWIGLGAGVAIGTIIANEAYRPRPGYYYDDYAYDGPYYYPSAYQGDPRAICAQHFRSFEWRTGLYTTYSGEKRLCPYLQ
jgi:BA14K-like protein